MHVIHGFTTGGAEADLRDKARPLRDVHGHEQTFLCLLRRGELAPELLSAGFPVEGPLMRSRSNVSVLPALRRRLLELGPDIVHSHLLAASLVTHATLLTIRRSRRPRWIAGEHAGGEQWGPIGLALNRHVSRAAARVTVPSAVTRDSYVTRGVPSERLSIVPNVVRDRRLGEEVRRSARARVLSELAIAPDATIVGTVSRLVPVKRLDVLVEAVSPLEVTLVIAGDGPERGSLERRARALGAADRVRFTGTRPDVDALLASFDVFALSSDSESFGIAIAEALGAGVPVVATRVGAVPEIVGPEIARDLVPPGDALALRAAIVSVLEDRAGARALSRRAGRAVRDRYSPDCAAAALDRVYRDVGVGNAPLGIKFEPARRQ